MTVQGDSNGRDYIGQAADVKPTDAAPGAQFYETDTGATYIYTGAAWVVKLGGSEGGGAATVANGANVVEGSTTDAGVITDANGTLSGKLRGLVVLMLSLITAVKTQIVLAAGEAFIGKVGSSDVVVAVTPTLTVAATYIANDYVGTSASIMTFAGMVRVAGGTITLMPALLIDKALQSISTELWLFDTAVTVPNDSAAWTITDADALKCVAILQFSTYFASAANSISESTNAPKLVKCAAGDTNLYGALVTRGAPAYASGDLTVKLRGYQS